MSKYLVLEFVPVAVPCAGCLLNDDCSPCCPLQGFCPEDDAALIQPLEEVVVLPLAEYRKLRDMAKTQYTEGLYGTDREYYAKDFDETFPKRG